VTSDRLQLSGTIKSIHFWLALILALCGSMGAFAQGTATARLSGRVTDSSGAGIADARITVTNKGGHRAVPRQPAMRNRAAREKWHQR